jgi:two-component system response regulator YesN
MKMKKQFKPGSSGVRKLMSDPRTAKRLSPAVMNALKYIDRNLPNIHSSSDISKALRLSREHVSRAFSKQTGHKMWEFVNQLKVERAKQMLLGKPHLVKQIYPDLGFGCQSTFYNAFKRYAGVTPGKFRKLKLGRKKGR